MTHIIADVSLLVLSAVVIWRCTANGFLKGILRSVRLLLAFLLAYLLGNRVGALLYNSLIYQPVRNFVYGRVDRLYRNASQGLTAAEILEHFPGFLNDGALADRLNSFDASSGDWVDSVAQSIASPFASVLSNLLAYVLVFFVSLILLSIAIRLLDAVVSNLPILDHINKLLGCIAGILLALSLCLVISSLIRAFFADAPIYTDSVLLRFFGESALLRFLDFLDVGGNVFSFLT